MNGLVYFGREIALRKVVTAIFAFLLLLGCAAAAIAANPYSEQSIELSDSSGVVKGTLMLPSAKQEGKNGAVALIIAGSGPTDRDGNSRFIPKNNSLKNLALALAENGIASLRYDKRGIGESTATPEADLRFETYVGDAKRWLQLLRADERFDKILVVGHSEGALVGMIAAQQVDVSAFVSLEGTSLRASDLLRAQLKPQLPQDLSDLNERILTSLEVGVPFQDVPAALQTIYRPSVQPYLISWFRYSPVQEIGKIKVPVLIVQGSADAQIEPQAADKLMRGNVRALLLRVDGMDHLLRTINRNSSNSDEKQGLQTIAKSVAQTIK